MREGTPRLGPSLPSLLQLVVCAALLAMAAARVLVERNLFSAAVTGGGAASLHWCAPLTRLPITHTARRLLSTPGASSHVIFAEVPYSRAALRSFLHREGGQDAGLCSRETAREMAKVTASQAS